MHDIDKNALTPAERFSHALERVKSVLDEPECIEYAIQRGPLTLDRLPDEAALRVAEVAERRGWPTADDTSIGPVRDFTDQAFLNNLFEHPSKSLPTDGELSDEELEAVDRNENALNNFVLNLRAVPIDNASQAVRMEDFYGLAPVVHRANALAPELFAALREATNSFDASDQDFAKNVLARKENADMVTALNMGYRIMGRLLKKDDLSSGVRDAHETLTA